MSQDLHLHSLVSDGELDPVSLLRHAAGCGLTRLSITDHDALGAYAWGEGAVFGEARRLNLELTVGLELDAELDGIEVHLLGYGVSLDDPPLNDHLERVRVARFERARAEIGIVNGLLGEGTIVEAAIFVPGRQTLMKPHFIHPILERGLFPSYETANAWYREHVSSGVKVPKPTLGEAIGLVHGAGGWAVLAHPGYYEKQGVETAARLPELQALGLDGVELDYPYHASSPHQFSSAEERGFISELRVAGERLGLRFTQGSDCHGPADFERLYGPPCPA
jgi:predicted metal-dependent phosphoesterase TrpH